MNPDLSDSEYDMEHDGETLGLEQDGSERGDGGSVGTPDPGGDDQDLGDEDEGDDDGFDAAFAAEIDQVDLDGAEADGDPDADAQSSDEEGGGLFGDGQDGSNDEDDEDDDDEDDDVVQARKLLNEEIRDLEAAVEKKVSEIAGVQNQLIKVGSNLFLIFPCKLIKCLFSSPTETIRGCPEEASRRFGESSCPTPAT